MVSVITADVRMRMETAYAGQQMICVTISSMKMRTESAIIAWSRQQHMHRAAVQAEEDIMEAITAGDIIKEFGSRYGLIA